MLAAAQARFTSDGSAILVPLTPAAAPAGDEVEGPLLDPDQPMDEDADADSPLVPDSAAHRLATSPNLAHSLPATLDLEPTQLARLRDSLYPAGDQASERGRACLRLHVTAFSAPGILGFHAPCLRAGGRAPSAAKQEAHR